MNSRGQAALEYLMTYGWALIVIAIVVGVLVFIVATPSGEMTCTSNSPGKINVISNNLSDGTATTADIGSVVVTNLTGGVAGNTDIAGADLFAAIALTGYTGSQDLAIGNTTLTPVAGAAGDHSVGTLTFTFDDSAGLEQTAVVTCQGSTLTLA